MQEKDAVDLNDRKPELSQWDKKQDIHQPGPELRQGNNRGERNERNKLW